MPARILLIDDDAYIVRVMSIWLERHGYEPVAANNGAQGLDIVRQGGIDLIVSDLNMPEMDGESMVLKLAELGHTDVPIILLTARCDRESVSEKLKPYGVSVYPKPFVPSRLVLEVERLLQAGSERHPNGQCPSRETMGSADEPVGQVIGSPTDSIRR